MRPAVERMVETLLFEGYALYPYTPDSVKNATPTPFGIVYPPAYAETLAGLFERVEMTLVVRHAPGDAPPRARATAVFLLARGPRHQAVEGRIDLPWHALEELEAAPLAVPFASTPEPGGGPGGGESVRAYLEVSATPLADGLTQLRACVCNTTALERERARRMDRKEALRRSLLSTHVVVELDGASFASPLEREGPEGDYVAACRNVNTWPVLASPDDEVALGASIFLPDHPRIAPESRGSLFDGTEIEEALLLHVQTLTDEEREAIAGADPRVREAIERARGADSDDLRRLHGRVVLDEPPSAPPRPRSDEARPTAVGEDTPGEATVVVDGTTFQRGGKVRLCPQRQDPFDRILDGRRATVERIFLDFDDRVYLGVTVDDDPGRDLFRETGRLLFFFADEVEVISP